MEDDSDLHESPNERSCKFCKYFEPDTYQLDEYEVPSGFGFCRRFPPKISGPSESSFPMVDDDDWCGEFDF